MLDKKKTVRNSIYQKYVSGCVGYGTLKINGFDSVRRTFVSEGNGSDARLNCSSVPRKYQPSGLPSELPARRAFVMSHDSGNFANREFLTPLLPIHLSKTRPNFDETIRS